MAIRCQIPTMSKTYNRVYRGNGRWTYELECGFKVVVGGDISSGPSLREPCPRCIMDGMNNAKAT